MVYTRIAWLPVRCSLVIKGQVWNESETRHLGFDSEKEFPELPGVGSCIPGLLPGVGP
jgi:hypothetical protein